MEKRTLDLIFFGVAINKLYNVQEKNWRRGVWHRHQQHWLCEFFHSVEIYSSTFEANHHHQENEQEEEEEIVNIDFDFFDVDKDVDFHAVKNLMRQLIGEESKKLNLSALADLVLGAPTTTIKTDGKESDPYAFLAPINMKEAKSSDYIKFIHKSDSELSNTLNRISNKRVALLLSERLINMPIQIVPAMYKIVLEETEKSEGEHYDYYVIPSRKYEVNDEAEDNSNKRVKTVEVDYYHHEDKFLEENATHYTQLEPKNGLIQTFIVIGHDELNKAIGELEDAIAAAFWGCHWCNVP